MNQIVECVPNFSEGRNQATVRALVTAASSVHGVRVLDHTMDRDHHRSVVTFAGQSEAVLEAAFRVICVATDRIDLRRHRGGHPRVGATDVVPFVPIRGATMQDCAQLARRLGQRVGQELEIPVFLYERAAPHPDHAPLEAVRRGGLKGLAYRMASDPDWNPDFGPSRMHKTAGAVIVGARGPLVAFNVNLRSTQLEVAQAIARAVRQSNGGVSHVKAIGVALPSRGLVQVAMNLTDIEQTSVHVAFEAVQAVASLHGVAIAGSEIVGLVPRQALTDAGIDALRLEGFDPGQVLESKIEDGGGHRLTTRDRDKAEPAIDLREATVSQLLDAVGAAEPVPAGASVIAIVGALSAALGLMGARLGRQRNLERRFSSEVARLGELAQADGAAYRRYLLATGLEKSNRRRTAALSSALHRATDIPLEIAERAVEAGTLLHECSRYAKTRMQSDLKVGFLLALAAAEAGLHTVAQNIKIQPNQRLKAKIRQRFKRTTVCLEELRRLCYTPAASQESSVQALPEKVRIQREWKSRSSTTTLKKPSRSPRKNSPGKVSSGN
ncbi:putative Formimidoyltransferase-cyclodeaminase [Nitrospira sp. KM1]|uniref:glutamate formimidoyltransferase n=1 Tax=Nitrospira sp. KM1 TaxID=1936990 RepID=UPI0013A76DF3|nr:glutamate formimidoyltransferase [Nitrospira sp. KM1]BCA55040.1 putative Formimidoyltransferase-cyclodeaminase [Nitrospira sp. KM1]